MAKSIMIQGTMSNVGKSLLCAALCRIFKQDGYRTAPFKSQNMALNSYITDDGLEMGRAQAVQAEAAGIAADVRMNPILLKPTSDRGSQVIVEGRVWGQYEARDYFARKKSLIPTILRCYNSLAAENDIIVIEGAGSPAEINLKQDDIVNMGLAELVSAPVLLVGDIDPGGVFAQLYGTVALLEPDEQARIRGLIINKFRGDKSLLDPGIAMLEEKTGLPVLGTIPYTRLDIDEEDSMAASLLEKHPRKDIDIAVIRLPRISNFTDFAPLDRHSQLGVRYVSDPKILGRPDLIILPGTKNTMADLAWLRETGLAEAVCRLAGRGCPVLGICGGYQMLGTEISDPCRAEGGGSERGLGLLPLKTVFLPRKTRKKTLMKIEDGFLAGCTASGYEIHMGITRAADSAAPSQEAGSRTVTRAAAWPEHIWGTYLHGLFDRGQVVEQLAAWLCGRRHLECSRERVPDRDIAKERQYDLLADTVRKNLDLAAIYRIMDL